jgi:hypothetical protein
VIKNGCKEPRNGCRVDRRVCRKGRMAGRRPGMAVRRESMAVRGLELTKKRQNDRKTSINGCRANKGGWKRTRWQEYMLEEHWRQQNKQKMGMQLRVLLGDQINS